SGCSAHRRISASSVTKSQISWSCFSAAADSAHRLPRCAKLGLRRRHHLEEVHVSLILLALDLQPLDEFRLDESAGSGLLTSGADREHVHVFVLRMTGVAADPTPVDLVSGGGSRECAPQLDVLDRSVLPLPAARGPAVDPLAHAGHQVLRVGREDDAAGTPQGVEQVARAAECHPVVRGGGLGGPVVAANDLVVAPQLDASGRTAGGVAVGELVPEGGLAGKAPDQLHGAEGRGADAVAQARLPLAVNARKFAPLCQL